MHSSKQLNTKPVLIDLSNKNSKTQACTHTFIKLLKPKPAYTFDLAKTTPNCYFSFTKWSFEKVEITLVLQFLASFSCKEGKEGEMDLK